MNELGREKLRREALAGTEQAFGDFFVGNGYCAAGVLLIKDEQQATYNWDKNKKKYGLSEKEQICPICNFCFYTELKLIYHLNDTHRLDFIGIAEKV